MITKDTIREVALKNGVDLFGVASIDRFENAPKGFHPKDIYSKTESVIALAIKVPSESLYAENPVPYTCIYNLSGQKMDLLTYNISTDLDNLGLKNVLIPSGDPFLYWNQDEQIGRAILSLRHVGYLAGLGKIGRNNLLINKDYGNMIRIGAILTDSKFESDSLADYEVCPPNCRICIDCCPQDALTGKTVIQKKCRPISNFKTENGNTIKKCFDCRRKCPQVIGLKCN
jgi:epoxyqueuosine reductase